MIYLLAGIISLAQGFFLTAWLLGPQSTVSTAWMLFAGLLAGLGLSGLLTFTSFLFFQELVPAYAIAVNILALFLLFFLAFKSRTGINLRAFFGQQPALKAKGARNAAPASAAHKPVNSINPSSLLSSFKMSLDKKDLAAIAVLAILTIPTIIHATLYPYGGWDAWSCWNLKARFLFLGGTEWTNMFDPALWRSNTAYPLLLPLINVWFWCFGTFATPGAGEVVSCLITFLTGGILYFSIKELTARPFIAMLAPAFLLLNNFMIKLASSQYSDLLIGGYLTLTLAAFFLYRRTNNPGSLQLALIFAGLMSFTKSEGTVLAGIILTVIALKLGTGTNLFPRRKNNLVPVPNFISWRIGLTLAAAFLMTVLFKMLYMPDSHTFVNGLSSPDKPTSLERLAVTLWFLGRELLTMKWNGLWIILAGGVIASRRKAWKDGLWTIPAILGLYLLTVVGVYWINTFFEIVWWLGNTLNRILFALTPAALFWLFLSVL